MRGRGVCGPANKKALKNFDHPGSLEGGRYQPMTKLLVVYIVLQATLEQNDFHNLQCQLSFCEKINNAQTTLLTTFIKII